MRPHYQGSIEQTGALTGTRVGRFATPRVQVNIRVVGARSASSDVEPEARKLGRYLAAHSVASLRSQANSASCKDG